MATMYTSIDQLPITLQESIRQAAIEKFSEAFMVEEDQMQNSSHLVLIKSS